MFYISIQHLFRFDRLKKLYYFHHVLISIQHLFRFDSPAVAYIILSAKFQYNTCFGSTFGVWSAENMICLFQYNTCFGSTKIEEKEKELEEISIQHLFRFDRSYYKKDYKKNIISIQHLFRFDILDLLKMNVFVDFNTTLVSVRRRSRDKDRDKIRDFNTTLVSVRLIPTIYRPFFYIYFNTTLVSVRPIW